MQAILRILDRAIHTALRLLGWAAGLALLAVVVILGAWFLAAPQAETPTLQEAYTGETYPSRPPAAPTPLTADCEAPRYAGAARANAESARSLIWSPFHSEEIGWETYAPLVANEIATEFPDVKWDKELVDAMTARMVNKPATLDTIVATNLHADILSDLAAALAGSLGIAPTANLDPERRYPSMFEPIHGSAFDIMGKGLANPVGTFWSCVMLLEHLGEQEAAQRLMAAIESVTADKALHTGDLGGTAKTVDVTRAVIARLAR